MQDNNDQLMPGKFYSYGAQAFKRQRIGSLNSNEYSNEQKEHLFNLQAKIAPTDPKLDRLAALLGQIQSDQKSKEERTKIFPGFPLKRTNLMRTTPEYPLPLMNHKRPSFEQLIKQVATQSQSSTPPLKTSIPATSGDINNKSIHDILQILNK